MLISDSLGPTLGVGGWRGLLNTKKQTNKQANNNNIQTMGEENISITRGGKFSLVPHGLRRVVTVLVLISFRELDIDSPTESKVILNYSKNRFQSKIFE